MKRILVYGLSNKWGGVESIVHSIITQIENDVNIDVLLSGEDIDIRHTRHNENVSIISITSWGESRRKFKDELRDVLEKKDYDYVWINASLMCNRDIINVIRKNSSAQIITHSHGSYFEESNKLKEIILLALHYLNRSLYRKSVKYKCMCSEKSGKWFYGNAIFRNEHPYLIKNGIDINKYLFNKEIRNKIRTQLEIYNSDEIVLFHAGRLTPVKNQSFLIDLVKEAISQNLKVRLLIAGSGELEEELKHKVTEAHLETRIQFLGNRNDINELYQAADIFLLPSYHEGFPVTLTEAQAAGLKCIVSSTISRETNITGNVKYLSISNYSLQMWIDEIKRTELSGEYRLERSLVVRTKRYDISDVATDLKIYLGI